MAPDSSASTTKVVTDIQTQIANILPTGTFLVFQVLAPLATNNGNCGKTEIAITSLTLIILAILCTVSAFSDSYMVPETKVVYYGIVTRNGLWNPNFRNAGVCEGSIYKGGGSKYCLEQDDFWVAGLSVFALLTFSLLTAPVTTCFYPSIPDSIVKTVPLLVGLIISAVCAFGVTPRNGIGFAMRLDPLMLKDAESKKLEETKDTAGVP